VMRPRWAGPYDIGRLARARHRHPPGLSPRSRSRRSTSRAYAVRLEASESASRLPRAVRARSCSASRLTSTRSCASPGPGGSRPVRLVARSSSSGPTAHAAGPRPSTATSTRRERGVARPPCRSSPTADPSTRNAAPRLANVDASSIRHGAGAHARSDRVRRHVALVSVPRTGAAAGPRGARVVALDQRAAIPPAPAPSGRPRELARTQLEAILDGFAASVPAQDATKKGGEGQRGGAEG